MESSFMCWSTVSENSLDKLETIQGDVPTSIMKIKATGGPGSKKHVDLI